MQQSECLCVQQGHFSMLLTAEFVAAAAKLGVTSCCSLQISHAAMLRKVTMSHLQCEQDLELGPPACGVCSMHKSN